jgi:hypothetical protein
VNVVMPAREEMAEFVSEKNGEKGQSKRKTGGQGQRLAIN